jgi:hypothetical protein
MSSHDARQEESQTYRDEHGTTAIRTDESTSEPIDRNDPSAGPVLLPRDVEPEPTTDDSTAVQHPPVTIEDGERSEDLDRTSDGGVGPGFGHTSLGEKSSFDDRPDLDDTTDSDLKSDQGKHADPSRTTDGADVSVGPDTETGALKDPVPDGTFAADAADSTSSADTTTSTTSGATTDTSATSIDPASSSADAVPTSSTTATSTDVDWRELQGRFVDDPQAAVKEAGALVEKALSDLRTRSENGSTEDLRTAFRRYRDLYSGLT